MNGGLGFRLWRSLRARWRFIVMVTRGFLSEIAFATITIFVAGSLIHSYHPEQPSFWRGLHAALALLTLQQELSFPEAAPGQPTTAGLFVLKLLWFVIPLLGVTVVAETLIKLGVTIFNRERNSEGWNVAVAQSMKDHTVVVGFGRIGYRVVGQLAPRDARIVVVESHPKEEFKKILEQYDIPLITGDARRDDVIEKANIRYARTVLCLTNEDLVNIEVGLNARERNPSVKVVLRMFDDNLAARIERAFDFQAVFSTTALAAPSFAAAVWNQKILHSLTIGDQDLHLARFSVNAGSPLIGLTIAQIEARYAVNILLHTVEGKKDLLPAAGNVITRNDALYLVGRLEGIDGFDALAGGQRTTRRSWRRGGLDDDSRALMSRKIEAYYDDLGERIERGDRYQSRPKKRALELVDARPGQRILEVGVGTGSLLGAISQRLGDARAAVGVDLAEGILRRARVRLAAEPGGVPPLLRATAIRLPFRDESFDRVVSTYVLDLLEYDDILIALSEMRRVVKTGALIVCAGLTSRGASPQARLVAKAYAVSRRLQPLWTGGCRPVDLEPLARRAGLRVVTREVMEQKGRASEVVCLSR